MSVRDRVKRVRINSSVILDEGDLHSEFTRVLGFPEFYGENWNAWIDCMSSIDSPEDGMSALTVDKDEALIMEIRDAAAFQARCPRVFQDLVECTAAVNRRFVNGDKPPPLLLELTE